MVLPDERQAHGRSGPEDVAMSVFVAPPLRQKKSHYLAGLKAVILFSMKC